MQYASVRDKFRSGDLIAFTHKKWGSLYDLEIQVVRAGTQSEYSHVAGVIVFAGRVFIVESVVPVIRLVPLSNYAEEGFYWVPMNYEISNEELEFSLSKVGKGQYSKWQAIKAQFRRLKIGEDDLWECAEFMIAAKRLSGIGLGDKATPSAVIEHVLQKYDTSVSLVKG
ncbi:hypothetical protein ACO0K9_00905 [Undibacterium sp. Ji50W]|uniref:hypothetical protein n=1 Tax=Undibacterium sp. Ji50W TaxID=3413041 RepID=UPI003BF06BBD